MLFRGKGTHKWQKIAEAWGSYGYACVQTWEDIQHKDSNIQVIWSSSGIRKAKPCELEAADALQPLADGGQFWAATKGNERGLSPAIILCIFDRETGKDVRLFTAGYRDAGDGTGCIEIVVDDLEGDGEDLYFQPVSTETAGYVRPDDVPAAQADTVPTHSFAKREGDIRRKEYADVAGMGVERILGRAKSVIDNAWTYGYPMVIGRKLHIVREVPEKVGNAGRLDIVECDPATLQMRACACGWSLWEGDVLGVELPNGLSIRAKVIWDAVSGGWAVECSPHNGMPSLPKQMGLEAFMDAYGEKATHCGNAEE